MILDKSEQDRIGARTREIEQRTGAQVLVAIVSRSRAYAEASWRAFALGAALTAGTLAGAALRDAHWAARADAFLLLAAPIGGGLAAMLLARALPSLARLLVPRAVRDAAVREHARALFLEEGVHTTRDRIGVLVLVSLLERRVEVVPDVGLAARLPAGAWDELVAAMRPHLAERNLGAAFAASLDTLEKALAAAGLAPAAGTGNELPRELVMEPEAKA